MRTRKKAITRDQLTHYDNYICTNPEDYRSKWHEYFSNDNKIHVELGTGRGKFLITLAQRNPHINYIGLEMKEPLIFDAVFKAQNIRLNNIAFLHYNAYNLEKTFSDKEVDLLFINFCDPWPKKRWAKRRLIHGNFLVIYNRLLNNGSEIHFKTDNEKLFEFSLNEFCQYDYKLKNITFDLHNTEAPDIVTTEYEDKFVSKGMRIYRCEAVNRETDC
ncbi:tRNA (guanosine(46)-N7)-methyltransferase TrmB [Petroclostridium sp. X23]|uniref:tRNA (guanosine(46)-N7)-methyltransferase TrmB n=1 Tax=Petroclostridium sp. X23 TaxID=3045146 RepID=UPI0024AE0236|nr:tRNA (guanosine(46)-N7)-methyltransferase TrmB [Petroclostridium sp. X23]WHH57914.1 tRNA (guanosine(46)-N7)-methyltransferase TrmB [Petroclostridium sp. X23]